MEFREKLNDGKVMWLLVFINILRGFINIEKILFILSILCICYIIIINKWKIVIPKIRGLNVLIYSFIISFIIGCFTNKIIYVLKGVYFITPIFFILILGYYMYIYSNKNLIKSLYVCGAAISISCFINALMDTSIFLSFETVRGCFGTNVYEVQFIFSMMICEKILFKKQIFSKLIDYLLLAIMVIQIALSMGRASIGGTFIIIFSMLLCSILINGLKRNVVNSCITILTTLILIICFGSIILPNTMKEKFIGKVQKSFVEISVKNNFNRIDVIANNWRAYEIKCAQDQWKGSNILVQLFGGVGNNLKLPYVPSTLTNVIINNEHPLPHNAYYSILIKEGIIGVITMIYFFASNSILLLRYPQRNKSIKDSIVIMFGFSIGMMFNLYFVRGFISQSLTITFGLVIGWMNAKLNNDTKNLRTS